MITEDELKTHLAETMPALMAARGMSQRELAQATGDSDTQVSRVIKGLHVPNAAFLCRIAEALECSLDLLCPRKPAQKTGKAKEMAFS